MKLIKNGKVVLNGTRTQEETEELLFRALEIIVEKGLSTNELWFIKNDKSWEEYTEIMKEIYFDDSYVEKNLKTQEEYNLLKEIM